MTGFHPRSFRFVLRRFLGGETRPYDVVYADRRKAGVRKFITIRAFVGWMGLADLSEKNMFIISALSAYLCPFFH